MNKQKLQAFIDEALQAVTPEGLGFFNTWIDGKNLFQHAIGLGDKDRVSQIMQKTGASPDDLASEIKKLPPALMDRYLDPEFIEKENLTDLLSAKPAVDRSPQQKVRSQKEKPTSKKRSALARSLGLSQEEVDKMVMNAPTTVAPPEDKTPNTKKKLAEEQTAHEREVELSLRADEHPPHTSGRSSEFQTMIAELDYQVSEQKNDEWIDEGTVYFDKEGKLQEYPDEPGANPRLDEMCWSKEQHKELLAGNSDLQIEMLTGNYRDGETLDYLIDRGCDVNARDADGNTVLDRARMSPDSMSSDAVRLLQAKGAKHSDAYIAKHGDEPAPEQAKVNKVTMYSRPEASSKKGSKPVTLKYKQTVTDRGGFSKSEERELTVSSTMASAMKTELGKSIKGMKKDKLASKLNARETTEVADPMHIGETQSVATSNSAASRLWKSVETPDDVDTLSELTGYSGVNEANLETGLRPLDEVVLHADSKEQLGPVADKMKEKGAVFSERGLMAAVERGNSHAVDFYLDKRVDVDHTFDDGTTALMRAATTEYTTADGQGDSSIMTRLLDAEPDLEATDESGKTALWHAVASGSASNVTLLLDQGASCDITDGVGNRLSDVVSEQRESLGGDLVGRLTSSGPTQTVD